MDIKLHSAELNRMMKTMTQCIDPKSQNLGNIEVIYDNNLFSIRGTNGQIAAVMSTPTLGGDGESFCVDGTMFARVCAMCNDIVTISTDEKICTIKGAGRTRIPIVKAKIPAFERVSGKTCTVKADAFKGGYGSVAHAISNDQGRVVLTGVLIEADTTSMRMVTLDGFRMAIEDVPCESQSMRMVVPGAFMKLVSASTIAGENITLKTDGKRIQASTDSMLMSCTLLSDDFPDYARILPTEFKTESLVETDDIQNALKCGSVVNSSNNLVKLVTGEDYITVMSNSEQADFDANVPCKTVGDILKIAFNHKYLMETIASIGEKKIVMKFNTSVTPCVIQGRGSSGCRLVLPVRVAG